MYYLLYHPQNQNGTIAENANGVDAISMWTNTAKVKRIGIVLIGTVEQMKKVFATNGKGELMDNLIWREDAIIELVFNEETKDIKCGDMRKVLNVLKKMPSAEPKHSIAEWQKDFREYINMLNIPRDDYNGIMEYINDLPSVEPKRKKGKWIKRDDCWDGTYYECSVCKDAFTLMEGTPSDNNYDFCPNCGSYNGGEEE